MEHDCEYTGGGKLSKRSQEFNFISIEEISVDAKADTDYGVD
jgi:hypothetical protein